MLKFQFHIIGCTDDIGNIKTEDMRQHDQFREFALNCKVSWSKNVMEEHDCPDQLMLGCNDCDFCVLLSLACYLESKIADNIGDCRFLFGENDNDNEPKRINRQYGAMLKKVWKTEEFIDLARHVRGDIGTHSIRKFASM